MPGLIFVTVGVTYGSSSGGRFEKQFHSIVYQTEAIQAELIKRGEPSEERDIPPQVTSRKRRGRHPDPIVSSLRSEVIRLYKMNNTLTPKELAELPIIRDRLRSDYGDPANFVCKTVLKAKKDGLI